MNIVIYNNKDIQIAITTLKNKLILGINNKRGDYNFLNEIRGVYRDINELLGDLDFLSDDDRTRLRFIYGLRCLFWWPILKIKTEKHVILLRRLRDECTGKILNQYDVIIDGITGPDAASLNELIKILMRNPDLKWAGFILEKRLHLRRLIT